MVCKTKFRKYHKSIGIVRRYRLSTNSLDVVSPSCSPVGRGPFGIKAIGCGQITAEQIETVRRILSRRLKNGKYWLRIFADVPVTAKPAEVRMGKGKGNISYWATRVFSGKVLFEFDDISYSNAQQITKIISNKLPIKVKLATKDLNS